MDTLYAYRGTRDLSLDLLSDLYLSSEESRHLHGSGMYLSQTYKTAEQYSQGYKKWGVMCRYKVIAETIVCIENYQVVADGYDVPELVKLMALEKEIFNQSQELRNIMKLKTVNEYPGYWTMPAEEQNRIMDEIINYNTKVMEDFKDHPNITKANELFEYYQKIKLLVQDFFKRTYPVMLFLDEDMIVIKNKKAKVEALSFDLFAEDKVLMAIKEEIKVGELTDSSLNNIPIEYASKIQSLLQELL